jgi:hypothetical protein
MSIVGVFCSNVWARDVADPKPCAIYSNQTLVVGTSAATAIRLPKNKRFASDYAPKHFEFVCNEDDEVGVRVLSDCSPVFVNGSQLPFVPTGSPRPVHAIELSDVIRVHHCSLKFLSEQEAKKWEAEERGALPPPPPLTPTARVPLPTPTPTPAAPKKAVKALAMTQEPALRKATPEKPAAPAPRKEPAAAAPEPRKEPAAAAPAPRKDPAAAARKRGRGIALPPEAIGRARGVRADADVDVRAVTDADLQLSVAEKTLYYAYNVKHVKYETVRARPNDPFIRVLDEKSKRMPSDADIDRQRLRQPGAPYASAIIAREYLQALRLRRQDPQNDRFFAFCAANGEPGYDDDALAKMVKDFERLLLTEQAALIKQEMRDDDDDDDEEEEEERPAKRARVSRH